MPYSYMMCAFSFHAKERILRKAANQCCFMLYAYDVLEKCISMPAEKIIYSLKSGHGDNC